MARRVQTPVVVGGVTMAAGDRVLLSFGAAGRDPAYFAQPQTVDLQRDPQPNLAFGTGVHRCIGEALARLVLRVGYEVLLERLPHFTVDPQFVPAYATGSTRHMTHLPLRFAPTPFAAGRA